MKKNIKNLFWWTDSKQSILLIVALKYHLHSTRRFTQVLAALGGNSPTYNILHTFLTSTYGYYAFMKAIIEGFTKHGAFVSLIYHLFCASLPLSFKHTHTHWESCEVLFCNMICWTMVKIPVEESLCFSPCNFKTP